MGIRVKVEQEIELKGKQKQTIIEIANLVASIKPEGKEQLKLFSINSESHDIINDVVKEAPNLYHFVMRDTTDCFWFGCGYGFGIGLYRDGVLRAFSYPKYVIWFDFDASMKVLNIKYLNLAEKIERILIDSGLASKSKSQLNHCAYCGSTSFSNSRCNHCGAPI